MWQFSRTIDGISKACEELETPITGGNVSFYDETLGEGIYPTPVIGIVGIIEDVHKAIGPNFREPGSALLVIRGSEPEDASDVEAEFGSSECAKELVGEIWGFPAIAGVGERAALQKALLEMIGVGPAGVCQRLLGRRVGGHSGGVRIRPWDRRHRLTLTPMG